MSIGFFLWVLGIAVLNFFVGAVLGRQWLLEELEDEARQLRLQARMRAEQRLILRRLAEGVENGTDGMDGIYEQEVGS